MAMTRRANDEIVVCMREQTSNGGESKKQRSTAQGTADAVQTFTDGANVVERIRRFERVADCGRPLADTAQDEQLIYPKLKRIAASGQLDRSSH